MFLKPARLLLAVLSLVFILSACGENDTDMNESGAEQTAEPIDVEINVPDTALPEEEVELKALVTQGDEKVTDADEVLFEIWQEGTKENSDKVEAEHTGEGVYAISYHFPEDGIFYVQSHVTARSMHSMPTSEIKIGQGDEKEEESTRSDQSGTENEAASDDHHGGHQHGLAVTANFDMSKKPVAGEESELAFDILNEGEKVLDGRIRLEIWQHGDEARDWIDAEEVGEGHYVANYTFTEPGDYMMVIHVENDEGLHEHIDQVISIRKE